MLQDSKHDEASLRRRPDELKVKADLWQNLVSAADEKKESGGRAQRPQ